jgi:hypothetical protein
MFAAMDGGPAWWLTSVYGPCTDEGKPPFLLELRRLATFHAGLWLLCGNFNMVYRAKDKSNGRVNRRLLRP